MRKYSNKYKEEDLEEIIKEFLPYIKYTAYKLAWALPPHLTIDDLISAGLMGLMDALERFEPGRVKLKTYAELRIKGSMIDEIRANSATPRSFGKKIKNINKERAELEKMHNRKVSDEEVAKKMDMSLREYFLILQTASSSKHSNVNDFTDEKNPDSDLDLLECFIDKSTKSPLVILEEKYSKSLMAQLIMTLPEKEKISLVLYYYGDLSQWMVGKLLTITESRVCQILSRAHVRLKIKLLQSDGKDFKPQTELERSVVNMFSNKGNAVKIDKGLSKRVKGFLKQLGEEREASFNLTDSEYRIIDAGRTKEEDEEQCNQC